MMSVCQRDPDEAAMIAFLRKILIIDKNSCHTHTINFNNIPPNAASLFSKLYMMMSKVLAECSSRAEKIKLRATSKNNMRKKKEKKHTHTLTQRQEQNTKHPEKKKTDLREIKRISRYTGNL